MVLMPGKVLILLVALLFFPKPVVRAAIPVATKSANLNVSARVAAYPQDLLLDFKNDKNNAVVGAEEEITYTITYGSLLDYGTPMTIEAEWGLGTVPDQSLYSYNILSYVAGSATKDYWGQSTPTVDPVHRRITWVVKRFPPNTIGKTLTFKLITPGRYVTDRNVNFMVRARLIQEDITKGWINVENTYSPTEFIRKELKGLHILTADIKRITDHSFSLFIVTTEPTRTTIYYGLDPDNLDQTITDNELADQKLITIDGLLPSTTYYYRILIENAKGIQRKTPEVFQVTTSSTSLIALLDQDRIMVTSRGVLLTGLNGIGPDTSIVVPRGVPVEFFLPFRSGVPASLSLSISEKAVGYKSVLALLNQNVLGIATDEPPVTDDQKIRFLQTQPRTYSGTVTMPAQAGLYDILLEADGDLTGTTRDMLATLVVSDPLTVRNSEGKPIEHALVYVERLDERTGKYAYFPAATYGSRNPSYTDTDGSVDMILPAGEYSINVNTPGYDTYQHKFTFDPSDRQPYPQIVAIRSRFAPWSYVTYYQAVVTDLASLANWNVDRLGRSFRFLDFSLLSGLTILTVLSVFANLKRVKVSVEGFIVYTEKRLFRLFRKTRSEYLFVGFVETGESGLPVHGAVVQLVDKKTRVATGRDITNIWGEFRLHLDPSRQYDLLIQKTRFAALHEPLDARILLDGHDPFRLEPQVPVRIHPVVDFIRMLTGSIFHALSDTLLFSVGILNLILYLRFGPKILPLFAVTALNALLWLEYEWHIWRTMNKH